MNAPVRKCKNFWRRQEMVVSAKEENQEQDRKLGWKDLIWYLLTVLICGKLLAMFLWHKHTVQDYLVACGIVTMIIIAVLLLYYLFCLCLVFFLMELDRWGARLGVGGSAVLFLVLLIFVPKFLAAIICFSVIRNLMEQHEKKKQKRVKAAS